MGPWARRRAFAALYALGVARGLVDDNGRYQPGLGIESLAPPEPTAEDMGAAVDLSKQPIEKIFRLLAFELMREEKRKPEPLLGLREFQDKTETDCASRLVALLDGVTSIADDVQAYHINVTGTVGLYWLLHEYPDEHSWVWVVTSSHERLLWKIDQHLSKFEVYAMDDRPTHQACLSAQLRTVLMNAAATWRKIYGDYIALLWNGVAFGMLGDVTSWREIDNETQAVEDGPGGPPPNASWSENIIFGNMWMSSVQKWLEFHTGELSQSIYGEVARLQAGLSPANGPEARWLKKEEGSISSFEFLRRQVWGDWDLDKGLLQGLLRYVLQPDYEAETPVAVADFGTNGGKYCEWLNDTGLVHAFNFDSTFGVTDITGGTVQHVDLSSDDLGIWRSFDWALLLDLGQVMQQGTSAAGVPPLLRQLRRLSLRGLVAAWPSALPSAEEFIRLVESEAGMRVDEAGTRAVRSACEGQHLAASVTVFRAASK